MTKILAVVNGKGGVGKTTTTVTLSECLSTRQRKIILIDAEPQQSATEWLDRCDVPFDYSQSVNLSELKNLKSLQGYDLALIDTPPSPSRDSPELLAVVQVADFILLPTSPDWMDIQPLVKTIQSVVAPARKQYCVLLVLVDPHSQNNKGIFPEVAETQNSLSDLGIPCLKNFVRRYRDLPEAHAIGKIVTQLETKRAKNAIADYKGVSRELQRKWSL